MKGTLRPEDMLTPEELAARLKVRKSWVYEQTRSRNHRKPLPRLNMGRYLRFDWPERLGGKGQATESSNLGTIFRWSRKKIRCHFCVANCCHFR